MTRKIFTGIILIALLTMGLCSMFLIGILYDHFTNVVFAELKNEAYFVSNGISGDGDDYLDNILGFQNRITLISPDGTVIYDNRYEASEMDNHSSREEVKSALETGDGHSTRYSDTIGEDNLYYAVKMGDGRIVRVSSQLNSVWTFVLGIIQPMIFVFALVMAAAGLLSVNIAKRITKPINEIDLNNPELCEPYDELAPLVQKIRTQNVRIELQMKELKRKRKEFQLITENMDEGFLIIDNKTELLSHNSAALRLLGVSEEEAVKNKSVLALNRSESFCRAVETALSGEHTEQPMVIGERSFNIVANPVLHKGEVTGVVAVILDVTEKEQREALRREFTSNVSHELKTPLTTIYGISDMLSGGIVKPDDVKGFSDTIRSEAERMITLINDIIKLSRLDEGAAEIEKSEVELLTVAQNVAERLKYSAEKTEVMLFVSGKSAVINGAPAIVEEMLYNLADNAIKYNRSGGSVNITVGERGGKKYFTVADTGIGIPKSEQERVFERFYRVDKSHSRRIGGTGLGLSIVKHGAAFHNAEVTLKSTENIGTEITVIF